ncbi:FAP24 protein, partial [Crotophaga sulcirostris]|nr:FAP24 protein [Crotophaga sulcirostris]
PVTAGSIVVPFGHVIGNEKWRGSEIAQKLQGKVRLIFEDGLGLVDFHLSNRTCVLYISEADLVAGDEYKRKLVLSFFLSIQASSLGGIVIVERTQISDQYFLAVQKLVVLELGMVLLPVANQGEAAQLITQLVGFCIRHSVTYGFVLLQVREQSKDHSSNPFLPKQCSQLAEPAVLRTVQQIPGVGKTKALLLLEQFGSIHRLCNAPPPELEPVVGQAVAQQIHTP